MNFSHIMWKFSLFDWLVLLTVKADFSFMKFHLSIFRIKSWVKVSYSGSSFPIHYYIYFLLEIPLFQVSDAHVCFILSILYYIHMHVYFPQPFVEDAVFSLVYILDIFVKYQMIAVMCTYFGSSFCLIVIHECLFVSTIVFLLLWLVR